MSAYRVALVLERIGYALCGLCAMCFVQAVRALHLAFLFAIRLSVQMLKHHVHFVLFHFSSVLLLRLFCPLILSSPRVFSSFVHRSPVPLCFHLSIGFNVCLSQFDVQSKNYCTDTVSYSKYIASLTYNITLAASFGGCVPLIICMCGVSSLFGDDLHYPRYT